MPGIKFKIDVTEAEAASKRLRSDLKGLGLETGLTETEIKKLEARMLKGMGADKAKEALDRVARSVGMTKKEVAALQGRSAKLKRAFTSLKSGVGSVTRTILSMKTAIVGLMGAAVLGGLGRSFLGAARQAEGYRVRLNALLGSVGEGNKLFQAMAKYAGEVPFQYAEIMNAATMLSGVMRGGVEEIKRWMPMIGDLAAASGLDIATTTGQIIRMYSAGAASADLFRERGILAMMGFKSGVRYTVEDTKKMMFTAWEAVGSKFKGVTKALAKTWDGLMSMMGDKWFQLRNLVMEAGVYDALKEALSGINEEFASWIKNNETLIKQDVPEYVDKIKASVTKMKSSLSGLVAIYRSLPEGVVGAAGTGVLARILFGSWKPAAIAAGVMLLKAQLDKFESRTLEGIEHELIRKGLLLGTDKERLAVLEEDLELLKIKEISINEEIESRTKLMRMQGIGDEQINRALADRYKQLRDNTSEINKTNVAINEMNKLLRIVPPPALPPEEVPAVAKLAVIDPKQLAKIEKAQAKLTDVYNKATKDRFDYAIGKYWEELNINVKIAGMRIAALRRAGAVGKQLQEAEMERYRLLGEAEAVYASKMKKLDEERVKDAEKTGAKQLEKMSALHLALHSLHAGIREQTKEGSEEQAKATIEQLTAMRSMYEDMSSYGKEYFGVVDKLIDKQAEEYRKLVGDEIDITAWAEGEKKKIRDRYDEERKTSTRQVADTLLSYWTSTLQQLGQQSKQAFEAYKRMQQLQAVIDAVRIAILAVRWAYQWTGAAAPYVAAGLSATLFGAMMARVAMIESQQYQGYATGGWLDTHPGGGRINEGAGGKDDVFLGATPGVMHMGMKDEYVFIMNKESAKRNKALLEALNEERYAKGGWVARGYGVSLSDITDPFEDLVKGIANVPGRLIAEATRITGIGDVFKDIVDWFTDLSEVPELKFDPDTFDGILRSIDQMLGKTTALEDVTYAASQQFKGWIKQLDAMGASEEQLSKVRDQEKDVIAKLTAEMKEETYKSINKQLGESLDLFTDLDWQLMSVNDQFDSMIERLENIEATADELRIVEEARATALGKIVYEMAKITYEDINKGIAEMLGTLSPLQDEVLGINDQFDSMIIALKEIHASESDLLIVEEKRAETIKKLTDEQKKSIEERLIQKAMTPDELAIAGITREFEDIIEEIADWAEVSGEGYEDLVTEAKKVYKVEMEAAVAQSEAAMEIKDSIQQWASVIESLDDQILAMQTGMESPADALERMAVLEAQISELLGVGWAGGRFAFPEGMTPEDAAEIQNLLGQYLQLAQESFQRPSSAYREIYDSVLTALEALRGEAEDIKSGYQVQLDNLAALMFGDKTAAELLNEISTNITSGITVATDVVIPDTISLTDAEGNVITSIQAMLDRSTVSLVDDTVNVTDSAGNIIDSFTAYLDRESVSLDVSTVGLSVSTVDLSQTTVALDTTTVSLDAVGIDGLKGVLEQIRANIYTSNQMLAHILNNVAGITFAFDILGGYPQHAQHGGIFSGPESGYPVILHGIEKVTPLSNGGSTRGGVTEVNVTINVNESKTPRETGKAVRKEFEGFLRSDIGRKIIQRTSVGRG